MSRFPLSPSACWLALVLCAPVCGAEYSITEIPQMTSASGINRHGVVVGDNAFYVHRSRVVNQLPTIAANGINDLGQIAAAGRGAFGEPQAEVIYVTGGSQLLGNVLTVAAAISNSGFVVGNGGDAHARAHALLWQLRNPTVTTGFGIMGPVPDHEPFYDPQSEANAVNETGVAVGWAETGVLDAQGEFLGIVIHAFRWENGTITDLGTLPGGENSSASGINDRGEIVGSSGTATGATHAFLIRRHAMIDLGNLAHDPQLNSSASAINAGGEIVGSSDTRLADNSVAGRAFIYRDGRMRSLTTLIERRSPLNGSVTLTDAPAISCNGWIAANGFDNTTLVKHAYLLIPRDRADGDRDRDDKDCRRR